MTRLLYCAPKRAPAIPRNPWIAGAIRQAFPSGEVKVLDIGCGGGFLSNYLAKAGFTVTGLDAAAESLAIAQRHDSTGRACYVLGDAYRLPYVDGTLQAACAINVRQAISVTQHVTRAARRVMALRYRQAFGRGIQPGHSEACFGQVI